MKLIFVKYYIKIHIFHTLQKKIHTSDIAYDFSATECD